MKAYGAAHLKDLNRQKVFQVLSQCDITSKTEISRLTGISVPTVIKIIHFFVEKELVEDLGGGEAELGRKPQMLRLNKNRYLSIGVVYEGDYLEAGLANLRNEILLTKRAAVKEPFETVMSVTICNLINELLVESDRKLSDVLGIGIGLPGIYDVEHQTVNMAPLIGLHEKRSISDLIDRLKKKYQLPIIVDNDLNMEVQGEFISKKLGPNDDLIYLSVGTGIGGGVMLNGKLRRGSHYMCGEVGYMTFLDDYVAGNDRVGWLEGKVNIDALSRKFGAGSLTELTGKDREAAIEYVSICLSLCINNMMMCYDSSFFSIGGEMFNLLGEDLFEAVSEKVKGLSVLAPNLYRASSENPGVIGAASVVGSDAIRRLLGE